MSKRNLIIIIIAAVIIIIGYFAFSSFFGAPSQLGSVSTGTNFISNLLPFGKTKTVTPTPEAPANVSGYVPPTTTTTEAPKILNKVSSMPIAGYGVFMKERFVAVPVVVPPVVAPSITTPTTGTTTSKTTKGVVKPTPPPTEFVPALRYAAKATGNIYETFADAINEAQFTTTVIPRVYDAYFANNCASVAMRYLNNDGKTIETFIGALPQEILGGDTTTSTNLTGSFLPENITSINISPDTKSLFYLFNLGDNESSAGITADSLGNKKVQVFASPFTEWLSSWPNSRMITLTTKPSTNVPGYMYAVDPSKKDFNKILSGINGLTTLASPSGKLILYSDNNLSLSVYNTTTKQTTSLGVKTLPEKCVWDKLSDAVYCAVPKTIEQTGYPDIWYQGVVSFADNIWKINVADGTTNLISDPTTEIGQDVDGTKLALDQNENYLFFVNKKDSYLWELNLK
jgi:hypothetical protein